jgi:enoyl-CoA hydratase
MPETTEAAAGDTTAGGYEMILTELHGRVGLIRLHRPKALNALCDQLMAELGTELRRLDADPTIGAVVLTGSEKAFAAGADIKEMKDRTFPLDDFIGQRWEAILRIRKPVIAAVAGFALGGGCELAMMCDMIVAAEGARFGQPEINLGVIPGAGGTQRLTRAVGKSKAMDMVLTGRMMDVAEAERSHLVSRIFPADQLVAEALKIAAQIAELSPVAVAMAKDSVNRAFETTLSEGVRYERALFLSLFGTPHQTEGMSAFVEKRKPQFRQG